MQYGSVTPSERTEWIAGHAREAGFDLGGVVTLEDWPELARFQEWLARGHAGEMRYLHDPRRQSPADVLAGARSIIVCALNYNTSLPYSVESAASEATQSTPRGWISRYAWGDDYHRVVGEKLDVLAAAMHAEFRESFELRSYVDTGPVAERIAAARAGLGWLAKNTCLINDKLGSWLFLGVILTTLDCAPSVPAPEALPADLCGNCTLCLDACPTDALVAPYVMDASRCISYLTIEMRGMIPEELRAGMGRMVFGCDICQDVCPWNRDAPASDLARFIPRVVPSWEAAISTGADASASLFAPPLEWLASLTEEEFHLIFRGNPVRRTKWRGMVRNACVALGNSGVQVGDPAHARITVLLARLADSSDEIIAQHARAAIGRLNGASESYGPSDTLR
jgi:epoxyqueuosine reductase